MSPFSGGRLHDENSRVFSFASLSARLSPLSRTSIKVERFFSCSTAAGVVNPPGSTSFLVFAPFVSTLCCPVIRRFRGLRADHRGFPGFYAKRFSVQVSYSVHAACVHVSVYGAALFWPSGAASLSGSATKFPVLNIHFIYCIFGT